jgi:hypothetical protein
LTLPLTATPNDPDAPTHDETTAPPGLFSFFWSGDGVQQANAATTTLIKQFGTDELGKTNTIPVGCSITNQTTGNTGQGSLDVNIITVKCPSLAVIIPSIEGNIVSSKQAVGLRLQSYIVSGLNQPEIYEPANATVTWEETGTVTKPLDNASSQWSIIWEAPDTHRCNYVIRALIHTDGCTDVSAPVKYQTWNSIAESLYQEYKIQLNDFTGQLSQQNNLLTELQNNGQELNNLVDYYKEECDSAQAALNALRTKIDLYKDLSTIQDVISLLIPIFKGVGLLEALYETILTGAITDNFDDFLGSVYERMSHVVAEIQRDYTQYYNQLKECKAGEKSAKSKISDLAVKIKDVNENIMALGICE